MTIACFSSTGNSLHVARALAGDTGRIIDIATTRLTEIDDDSRIGIVTPVVCGDIPAAVRRFLLRTRLRAPYIFGIVTYGYTPGRALAKLGRTLYRCDYLASVMMPDSCLTLRHPDKELRRLDTLAPAIATALARIVSDIDARVSRPASCSLADSVSALVSDIFHIGHVRHRDITVDGASCIGCGQCARLCPSASITMTRDRRPEIADTCDGCLTCVNRCPRAALHCRGEKSHTSRYNHPAIHHRP